MRGLSWILVVPATFLCACEGQKPSRVDELVSANIMRSAPPIPDPTPSAAWSAVPPMSIDTLGIKIGNRGATGKLKDNVKNMAALTEAINAVPHKGKRVTLVVHKKAEIYKVVETVWLLGKAGVPEVLIKTTPRQGLTAELVVVPESATAEKPADCSVTAMVTPKNAVGVWSFGRRGGKKSPAGFGGPDLSSAEEDVENVLKSCKSDRAFFTAAYNMPWEHAYNVGATIKKMDKDGQIQKLILLGQEPVAGVPVKLRK